MTDRMAVGFNLALGAFVAAGCASPRGAPAPAPSAATFAAGVCRDGGVSARVGSGSVAPLDALRDRAATVPCVDHHQHLVGPTAASPVAEPLPIVDLPPALARVLEERNRLMGQTELGDLYTEDAQILAIADGGDWWRRGRSAVADMVRAYTPDSRFEPNAYALGDSVGWITGVVRSVESPTIELNFMLGLRKGEGDAWRIASEQATLIPPRAFAHPITADDLIHDLDVAGIQRAVVLSVAYWFGSPGSTRGGDPHANTRAENDWTAAQAALHPDRLVAFCGIAPLADYAVREVRRCARELGMRGVKMHFRSSRVDLLDAGDLEKVRAVFEAANELGMALVVHAEQRDEYGPEHARAMLEELLPAAPDVTVQIAHLWGGNDYRADVLRFWADARAAADPRTRNLYFDLTEVGRGAGGDEAALADIALQLRRIGLDRVLYGSDAQATPNDPPAALRWAMLRQALPLSNEEWRTIAGNVAPYVR